MNSFIMFVYLFNYKRVVILYNLLFMPLKYYSVSHALLNFHLTDPTFKMSLRLIVVSALILTTSRNGWVWLIKYLLEPMYFYACYSYTETSKIHFLVTPRFLMRLFLSTSCRASLEFCTLAVEWNTSTCCSNFAYIYEVNRHVLRMVLWVFSNSTVLLAFITDKF